ncbi:expressed unknown protein [Ectocarpus siliculosus]|uniref:Uncharacterized protein n=1 Tax=Ectocarpus siliculosus TaxID=2880 RepID=D7G1C6_ECTSI|nr:expressed unknown protein [Ectocarpus siliculosus]|eukprot:CBJ33236.1 expressed unknown protein [Ectocarpus siliculosus]
MRRANISTKISPCLYVYGSCQYGTTSTGCFRTAPEQRPRTVNASRTPPSPARNTSAYDPEQPAAIDLDSGCTGVIADGDLVVKDWDEPPLHLLCAKREWRKTVISILRKKQQLRDLDSTEKQEAAQPSAEVPANLVFFLQRCSSYQGKTLSNSPEVHHQRHARCVKD